LIIVLLPANCKIQMNKASIAEKIQEKLGSTRVVAEEVMDIVIDSIVSTLKSGGEVSIAGLGIFSTKQREARQARNPRTGETISVPAMKVPKFRAAKGLKEAVK
jgi:DNA-binding protein HU-beta